MSNLDRLRAILYRERALENPLGYDIAGSFSYYLRRTQVYSRVSIGIRYLYLSQVQELQEDRYIRHLHESPNYFIVTCFSSKQAELFKKQHSITLDASYKRVHGSICEVTIVTRDELDGSDFLGKTHNFS